MLDHDDGSIIQEKRSAMKRAIYEREKLRTKCSKQSQERKKSGGIMMTIDSIMLMILVFMIIELKG